MKIHFPCMRNESAKTSLEMLPSPKRENKIFYHFFSSLEYFNKYFNYLVFDDLCKSMQEFTSLCKSLQVCASLSMSYNTCVPLYPWYNWFRSESLMKSNHNKCLNSLVFHVLCKSVQVCRCPTIKSAIMSCKHL